MKIVSERANRKEEAAPH